MGGSSRTTQGPVTLHRRQHVHRPWTIRRACSAERKTSGRSYAVCAGQAFPPVSGVLRRGENLWPGHVVAHNYVANFSRRHRRGNLRQPWHTDGSDAAAPVPSTRSGEYWERRPVAIDFYCNNYPTQLSRQRLRNDRRPAQHLRVMRNVMINLGVPPDVQPAGGRWRPSGLRIRNIMYHAPGGSTRMTSGAAGVVFYNNDRSV